jgi:hypothetical protein
MAKAGGCAAGERADQPVGDLVRLAIAVDVELVATVVVTHCVGIAVLLVPRTIEELELRLGGVQLSA